MTTITDIDKAFKNCEKDIKVITDRNDINEIGTIFVTLDILKIKVEDYVNNVMENNVT